MTKSEILKRVRELYHRVNDLDRSEGALVDCARFGLERLAKDIKADDPSPDDVTDPSKLDRGDRESRRQRNNRVGSTPRHPFIEAGVEQRITIRYDGDKGCWLAVVGSVNSRNGRLYSTGLTSSEALAGIAEWLDGSIMPSRRDPGRPMEIEPGKQYYFPPGTQGVSKSDT